MSTHFQQQLASRAQNAYNVGNVVGGSMDVAEFEALMMQVLIGGLVVFMAFIVYDLAKKSNAGKWGTFVLFGALGLGVLGFLIKTFLVEIIL